MLRLLSDAKRLCCPACSDVELRLIAACDGTSFLACGQCLRRFDAAHKRNTEREAPKATAFSAFMSPLVRPSAALA
jgi:hypothetical protein